MALTHLRGKVARPDGRRRAIAIRFLVDTGAVYTVLPEKVFTVEGQTATSPVVLGGTDDAPLLGAVTLETLGLMVNPLTRELLPMRLMQAGTGVNP